MHGTRQAVALNLTVRTSSRLSVAAAVAMVLAQAAVAAAPESSATRAGHAAVATVRLAQNDTTKPVAFNIKAQPMSEALTKLGEQSGLTIIVETKVSQGIKAAALSGQYTPDEALARLLEPAGLKAEYLDSKTVAVRLASESESHESHATHTEHGSSPIRLAQAGSAPNAPLVASASSDQGRTQESTTPSSDAEKSGGGIQEIVVTAQKRAERMQDVPIAITSMSAEDLAAKGITSFDGVAKASPSITFTAFPSSSDTLIIFMRGQGLDGPSLTRDSAVGLYQDGFYLARSNASTFDLGDIERVEVLRGPQGTLYGRNTTGGAVNMISKPPSGEFGFKQEFSAGSRNLFRSLTTVDLPAWNDLAAKVTWLKSSVHGYVENTGGDHDFGEQAQKAGRVALRWTGVESLTADYFLEKGTLNSTPMYFVNSSLNGQDVGSGTPYYANPNGPMTHTYRPFDLELSSDDYEGHGLTLAWDVNPALTLKSLTGYRRLKIDDFQDYGDAFAAPFATEDRTSQHQFSQEFQLIGNWLDKRVNYVAGLYYFSEAGSHQRTNNYGAYYDVTMDSKSKALYAQLSWTPPIWDDRLELTVGARETRDEKSAARVSTSGGKVVENGTASGDANSQSYSRFTPSLTASYKWTDDINTYAKVSTGYKAGGSCECSPTGTFNHVFGPEKLTNYEVGLKSYWFNRSVRLNLAAFDSKYQDIQYGIPLGPPNFNSQAYNIGDADIKGVEMELLVAPTSDLTFDFNATWMHSSVTKAEVIPDSVFDPSTGSGSPYALGENIKDLFALEYTPKFNFNVSADYTYWHFDRGSLSARLDYRWTDSFYNDPTSGSAIPGREYDALPSYGVLDGRLTMALDLAHGSQVKVSLWGKNLAHHDYYQFNIVQGPGVTAYQSGPGGTIGPVGYTSRTVAWAEPASYGIDLVYRY